MTSYKLKNPHLCNCCGRTHTETSPDYKVSFDELFGGVYWNCACGSTMFAKPETILTVSDELDRKAA